MDRPIVAVLAGGDSTRMGFDKAMAPVGDATMLEAVVNAVASIGDVVVVGRSTAPAGITAIPDHRTDARGPLTGLETVLALEPNRTVVLVAVDHPFVRPETLQALLRLEGDAVVPIGVAALALGLFTVFHPRWRGVAVDVDPADLDAIEEATGTLREPRRGRRPSP